MDNTEKPTAWHLEKRVNVGHLLTTILLVAAMFRWTGSIDSTLAVQQARIDALENVQSIQIEMIQKDLNRMSAAMDRINTRLEGWGNSPNR